MGSQLSSNNHLNANPIETRTYLLANHSSKEAIDTPPPKINKNDDGDNPKTASVNIVLAESDIVDYSRDTKFKNKEILESLANDLLNVIGRLNEIQETTESHSFSTIQSELNCVHTKLVDRAMDEKPRKLRVNKSCLKNIYTGQLIDCDLRTLRYKVGSGEYPKVILNQTFGDQHGNNPIREGIIVSVEPLPPCEQNEVYCNNIREAPVMAKEPAVPFVNQKNQYSDQSDRTINNPNSAPLQRSNLEPRRLTLTGSGHYLNINQQDRNQAPSPAIINTSIQTSENQVEINNDMSYVFDPPFSSTIIDQARFQSSIQQPGQSEYGMTNNSGPQTHSQRNNILTATGPAEYAQRQNQTNNFSIPADPMEYSQRQNRTNHAHLIGIGSAEYVESQNQTNNVSMAACPQNQSQHKNQTNNVTIEASPMNRSQGQNKRNNVPKATASMKQSQCQNQTNNVPMAACPQNQSQHKNQSNNVTIEASPMNRSQRKNQREIKQSQRQNKTDNVPIEACAMKQSQCQSQRNNVPIETVSMKQSQRHNQTGNVPMAACPMNQSQHKNQTSNVPMKACPTSQSQCQSQRNNVPMAACPMNQSQHKNQTSNVPMKACSTNQSQCQSQRNNVPMAACPMNQSQQKKQPNNIPIEACPVNLSQCQSQRNNVPIATVSMKKSQRHNQTNNVPIAICSTDQSIAEELHNSNQTLAIYDLIKQASKTIPFNVAAVENFFNVIGGLKGRLGWKNLLLVVVENIRTFTAINIFNKLTYEEVGHFNITAPEMRSVYESGLLELFQYIKNLNTLQNPYAIEQFTPSTVQLIIEEKYEESKHGFYPTNKSSADLNYYQNTLFAPQSYIDFSAINREATLR